MDSSEDRNFDPITQHFIKKVYGGLKGDIRLAVLKQDLKPIIDKLTTSLNRPLRILDVGAGLGQLSIELAVKGHAVTINDISVNMLEEAKKNAKERGVIDKIDWKVCPYQELVSDKVKAHNDKAIDDQAIDNQAIQFKKNDVEVSQDEKSSDSEGKYDVILCHALLEWLAEPELIFNFFNNQLTPKGILSVCFYNPASYVYRNLMMGNFKVLKNDSFKSDNIKSLTPNHPVSYQDVAAWLKSNDLDIQSVSGLRVFHDYVTTKRGGNLYPESVLEMELEYSNKEPFKWLGRYLHVIAHFT